MINIDCHFIIFEFSIWFQKKFRKQKKFSIIYSFNDIHSNSNVFFLDNQKKRKHED